MRLKLKPGDKVKILSRVRGWPAYVDQMEPFIDKVVTVKSLKHGVSFKIVEDKNGWRGDSCDYPESDTYVERYKEPEAEQKPDDSEVNLFQGM